MSWIQSHQALADHPKTRKLARILNTSKPTTIGHLHCFWWWAFDYAKDGDLSRFDSMDLAIAAEWDGDPDDLINALIKSGFVDQTEDGLAIHDWSEYGGKLHSQREADAERKRQRRREDSGGNPNDVPRTSGGRPKDVPTPSDVEEKEEREERRERGERVGADAPDPALSPPDDSTPPTKQEPMPRNGPAQTMLAVLHEDILKTPPPTDYGRAVKKADELVKAGCRQREFQEIVAWMLSDPWYAERGVTIFSVFDARDKYLSAKSHPAKVTRVSAPSRRTSNASGEENMTNAELDYYMIHGKRPA